MHRLIAILGLAISVLVLSADATHAEMGAIKRFVRFPLNTYALDGNLTSDILEEATTPHPSGISVDGAWPDKKLLLISFGGQSYHILFRAVEMNDQTAWDTKMAASGGLACSNRTARRTGGDPKVTTAGTKGFSSPC